MQLGAYSILCATVAETRDSREYARTSKESKYESNSGHTLLRFAEKTLCKYKYNKNPTKKEEGRCCGRGLHTTAGTMYIYLLAPP